MALVRLPKRAMSAHAAAVDQAQASALLQQRAAVSQDQLVDGALLLGAVLFQWQSQPATLSWRNRILLALHSVFAAFYLRSGMFALPVCVCARAYACTLKKKGVDLTGQFFKTQIAVDGPFSKWLALGNDKDVSGKKWLVVRFFFRPRLIICGYLGALCQVYAEHVCVTTRTTASRICRKLTHDACTIDLFHGLIRAYAALSFDNKIARQNALISYVCEIFQNAPLVSTTPDATPADSFKVAIVMALWLASLDGVAIDKDEPRT